MSRRDLGFVVSRAFSIWLLITTVGQLSMLWDMLGSHAESAFRIRTLGFYGIQIGAAILLWTGANSFGGRDSGDAATPPNPGELKDAMLTGVGLFFFVTGLVKFVSGMIALGWRTRFEYVPEAMSSTGWLVGLIELIVGALLLAVYGRFFGGLAAGLRRAWSVSDEEPS